MTRVTRVGDQIDVLGESPLWDEREQALYWVDIRLPAVRRLDHASGRVETFRMPDLVGSIAFCDGGRLLVALPDRLALFDAKSGRLDPFAAAPNHLSGHRFNDGRCDRQGRFWVGSMHNITRAPEGILYRVDTLGRFVAMRSGISIPNSLTWSPDARTMYFADSLLYTIFAFDFDAASGEMSRKRVFATTRAPAFPDGSAVDEEGCLWNAEFNGWRVVRYAPDGRIDRVIEVPTHRPTCCAFGGHNLDQLYITSASQLMSPEELKKQPLAGALFVVDAGVRGLVEPRFAPAVTPTWE